MQMNYVPIHSRDHASSEYVSHVGLRTFVEERILLHLHYI